MDGVDQLVKLLALVKRDGVDGAFSEDSYCFGRLSDVENVNFQAYPEPLRSMRHSLEESKLCMSALNNIKARLAKKIRSVQNSCEPLVLGDGIERIPNEILANIFEAGHQTSEDSRLALRVSHVSRRFRQVSLRTPSIWTRLSSLHPEDQTEAFISRSGQYDLHVHLYDAPVDKLRSSLQLIAPHLGRWSKLWLLNGDVDITDEVGSSFFPRLRYIYHEMETNPKISQWVMPLLRQFDGYYSTFPPGVSIPCLSQLTCLKLCFEEDDSFDVKSLAQVLHQSLNLRELWLELHNCDGPDLSSDSDADGPAETPKPQSFHIESLQITLRDLVPYYVVTSLYSILQYMRPALVDISLLLYGDPHDYLPHSLFPYAPTIQLRIGLPCSLPFLLRRLLENDNSKIVHSVQFKVSSFDRETVLLPEWTHFRLLRHLRFHNCAMMEERHVEAMARWLLACGDFQSLEIISCHKLSEEFLWDLQDEVGERLIWSL